MTTKAREVFLYIFLKIVALSLKLDIDEPSDFLSYRDMISDVQSILKYLNVNNSVSNKGKTINLFLLKRAFQLLLDKFHFESILSIEEMQ